MVDVEYLNGPDQLLPADSLKTTAPDGAVLIRQPETHSDQAPISVPTLLRRSAERSPNNLALAVKRNDVWKKWTYNEYYKESRIAAKAFIKLGLERFHSVGILGFNAPEWFISQNGAIFAGGFASGIYTTNSPEACKYIALNCRANFIVVEDEKQLDKIIQIKDDLPHLKGIIQYIGQPRVSGVLSWDEFMAIGQKESDEALEDRLRRIAINQCCALIYTSGTTGPPKGVMMSHDNFTWTSQRANEYLSVNSSDTFVTYLPLSHSAGQMIDNWMTMAAQAAVYFADKNALKGSLIDTLREVRPTFFFGVPRIYEKIQEKMQEIGKSSGGLRRAVADWAKKTGLNHNLKAMEGNNTSNSYTFPIAKKLVFDKVKQNLGFDRTRILGIGAAPMSKETFQYFLSLDIPLYECYGMSESSGPHCGNRPGQHRAETVGPTLDFFATKIVDPDPEGNGEICLNSRNVLMGYLFNPEKTEEAIDDDGWLHSGDIGTVDEDGYYKITGRIKELIITAGGENIPPVLIEDVIKRELPIISNVMVIGDRRKFLSCLLTAKSIVDPDTLEPKSDLTTAAKDWCKSIGSKAKTVEDLINDELVRKAIQEGIDRANQQATSNAQRIQKWTILDRDFSVPGGELGPTLKLKRHYVLKKYDVIIKNFYNC